MYGEFTKLKCSRILEEANRAFPYLILHLRRRLIIRKPSKAKQMQQHQQQQAISPTPTPTTMSQQDEQKGATTDTNPPSLPLVDETESVNSDNNNSSSNVGNSSGSTVYKYRDFSTVNEDDEDAVGTPDGSPVPAPSRNTMETSIRVQKFPVKLYAILAQKEFNDIISWMPHGRSWKVLKPNVFESLVMPLFFEYSNYHSFNRLVNAWSFRRVSSGPDRGSYYHEVSFRQDLGSFAKTHDSHFD